MVVWERLEAIFKGTGMPRSSVCAMRSAADAYFFLPDVKTSTGSSGLGPFTEVQLAKTGTVIAMEEAGGGLQPAASLSSMI